MYRAVALFVALFGVVCLPGGVFAQTQNPVVQEIRETIRDTYAYATENLEDKPDSYSAGGAQEFWSSGGLRILTSNADGIQSYESFNMIPKYISVIPMGDDYATALYYVEGSFQVVGEDPVTNYFTRGMEVYVKENGEWKVLASHWSPVVGGRGVDQTVIIG